MHTGVMRHDHQRLVMCCLRVEVTENRVSGGTIEMSVKFEITRFQMKSLSENFRCLTSSHGSAGNDMVWNMAGADKCLRCRMNMPNTILGKASIKVR